jgi:magnesium transporter
VITVNVLDDQQDVVNKVAKLDVLAIPVLDQERRIVGIVTHDDVIDLVRDEAADDALRSAAVEPLEDTYLRTPILELSWKRGVWLAVLLCFALIPAFSLKQYENRLDQWAWLIAFIPLIISSGGNSGNQSATLVITALSQGHASGADWLKIVLREVCMGFLLGILLATIGSLISMYVIGGPENWAQAAIVPVTLVLVVMCGAVLGAALPLVFRSLGLDPALMSNPFVAGICDILGIVIYMSVAWLIMG